MPILDCRRLPKPSKKFPKEVNDVLKWLSTACKDINGFADKVEALFKDVHGVVKVLTPDPTVKTRLNMVLHAIRHDPTKDIMTSIKSGWGRTWDFTQEIKDAHE